MAIRKLSPELQRVAEQELFETSEKINDGLNYIREWLSKQPHLKVRTDDQSLLSFLRGCKFSLQRTLEKLDYFYTCKTLLTEFYSNRDPFDPNIQEVLKLGPVLPLPNTRSPGGPRILFLHLAALNPDKASYISFIKVYIMIMDVVMQEDDNAIVSGIEVWSELKNASTRYAVQITPTLLKKSSDMFNKGYPMRLKNSYSTNCPSVVVNLINICKSFASKKISERILIYSENTSNDFDKVMPKHLQPKELGGENGSLKELKEYWKQKVESYKDWFLEDEKYGTKEHLRVGIPKSSSNMFGVEGTFRKLGLD